MSDDPTSANTKLDFFWGGGIFGAIQDSSDISLYDSEDIR